jgi:N,N'-diacetylbacillosaminyl-diphospho-undecaprenol alpha-1,3-N-acetylgalactosaminyltransferase
MKTFGFLSHLDVNLYIFRTPIMKELIKRSHKVYAICPEGDKNQALKNIGCEVINYTIDRKSLNPFSEKKSINNIYRVIKDLEIDILHTFTAKPNIYGTLAAKKAGVPVVLNLVEGLGSFYVEDNMKNMLVRNIMERLYKKAFKLSDGCVFVNTSDPEYMIKKRLIKKEKVKIIKSVGVDTEKFSMTNYDENKLLEIRKNLKLENKIVVLMVARAIWDKGVKEYYKASNILNSKYQNVEFLLVGGIDKGNHSCASEEFLENGSVKWLGHRDDVVDITAISDIYVLPSYREGLPATLMEASSMAKPMVATDTFGCRDVVDDGENGFLVPVRDFVKLAEKIEILINDEDMRKTMGQKALKKAQNEFDVRKVVKQYLELYEKHMQKTER